MTQDIIYLDNAATSFPKPSAVLEAVVHYHRHVPASAGRGAYREARAAGAMLDDLRAAFARLINAQSPERVVFGLNGTDALNLAIRGAVKPGDHVITTCMDHNSVLRPLHQLERGGGITVTYVGADALGVVDAAAVAAAFTPATRLVVMTHASNVTGAIQPAAAVGALARARGAWFLLDAAQTAGSVPIDVEAMSVDLLACPGHKALMGPQGTGVLWIRPGVDLEPLRTGGTGNRSDQAEQPDFLPDRFEPGAHNGPGLAGLLASLTFIHAGGVAGIAARKQALTAQFLEHLRGIPGARVLGPADAAGRLPILSVVFDGVDAHALAVRLDAEAEIKVRAGLHCAPFAHRHFRTTETGAVRFSPGYFTSDAQVDRTFAVLRRLLATSRS